MGRKGPLLGLSQCPLRPNQPRFLSQWLRGPWDRRKGTSWVTSEPADTQDREQKSLRPSSFLVSDRAQGKKHVPRPQCVRLLSLFTLLYLLASGIINVGPGEVAGGPQGEGSARPFWASGSFLAETASGRSVRVVGRLGKSRRHLQAPGVPGLGGMAAGWVPRGRPAP